MPDRATGDDFLLAARCPIGTPVVSDPKYPYVPNGGGRQSTYRVADLTNPMLQDWAKEKMKKANDDVLAGKVPYITRERCWPAGVPGFAVYTRGGQPLNWIHTAEAVVMVNELNQQTRHIYLNVPHTANPKPSWYGESVGHYEGDELVVDTIGLNARTFVDNYRTPHTEQIHVVERYKMIEGQDPAGDDHGRGSRRLHHAVVGRTALASDRSRHGRVDLRREQRRPLQLRRGADAAGCEAGLLSIMIPRLPAVACSGLVLVAFAASGAAQPTAEHKAPRLGFSNFGWFPVSDDFQPPLSGPGPVLSDAAHPYSSNQTGRQPTFRIADVTNPILQPWAADSLRKTNEETRAGKVALLAPRNLLVPGCSRLRHLFAHTRRLFSADTDAGHHHQRR